MCAVGPGSEKSHHPGTDPTCRLWCSAIINTLPPKILEQPMLHGACHPFSTLERKTMWNSLNLIFLINISELSFGHVVWSCIQKCVFQFWLGFYYTTAAFQSLRKFLGTTLDFRSFWFHLLKRSPGIFGACKSQCEVSNSAEGPSQCPTAMGSEDRKSVV